jgi:hypothetical protein
MKWPTKKTLIYGMLSGILTLTTISTTRLALAFPNDRWALQSGEHLEVLRDYACFGEGKAGERTTYKTVTFSKDVLSAEVFISGFNMWYTREGHDHEVMQERVDAWINGIGIREPDSGKITNKNHVAVKLMYVMKDEDTGDSDDFNNACIGFTVIARTK